MLPRRILFRVANESAMVIPMNGEASQTTAKQGELVALMDACAAGDRQAFATLYERTSAKLYGICLRVVGNEPEAQDVLQETYIRIWQKAERFDSTKASPITWLAVLARNKAIDRLRKRTAPTQELESAFAVQDDAPSPFEIIEREQGHARLAECLGTLEEGPRTAIRSAFLDGITYPELARRQGVPIGTMKSWIRRGLQRLRGCLDR
jgi:RNA polymerase sigma-70 factor (ECF subfamily)